MFSFDDVSVSNSLPKIITPGVVKARVERIELRPAAYDKEAYFLNLIVETEPISGFVGFAKDPSNPAAGNYQGQIGTVSTSQYAYKDAEINLSDGSKKKIYRDMQVLTALKNLTINMGLDHKLKGLTFETIQQAVLKVSDIVSENNSYYYFVVAGKEYINSKGYSAYNLFLPKVKNGKHAVAETEETLVTFDPETHIIRVKQSNTAKTNTTSSSDEDDDLPF